MSVCLCLCVCVCVCVRRCRQGRNPALRSGDLGFKTLSEDFCGFTHILQANIVAVSQVRPRPLIFTSFPTYNSAVIMQFHTTGPAATDHSSQAV
jgi:hypothetical protein